MSQLSERKEIRENRAVAEKLDPKWVKRDRIERFGMFIAGAAALIAIAVATVAIFESVGAKDEVRRFIQKTPCALHPAGNACSQIKERIAREGSLRNPCIEHQRVTGRKGANCSQFFIPPIERATGEPPAPKEAAPGTAPTALAGAGAAAGPEPAAQGEPPLSGGPGGSDQAHHPAPGPVPPAPHESGGTAPVPTGSDEERPPAAQPEASSPAPAPEPAGTAPNPVTKVGEVVGGAVEGVTGTTGEAVKGVGETAGGAVGGLTESLQP